MTVRLAGKTDAARKQNPPRDDNIPTCEQEEREGREEKWFGPSRSSPAFLFQRFALVAAALGKPWFSTAFPTTIDGGLTEVLVARVRHALCFWVLLFSLS